MTKEFKKGEQQFIEDRTLDNVVRVILENPNSLKYFKKKND